MQVKVIQLFDNNRQARRMAETFRQDPGYANVQVYLFDGLQVISHLGSPGEVVLDLPGSPALFIVEAYTVNGKS